MWKKITSSLVCLAFILRCTVAYAQDPVPESESPLVKLKPNIPLIDMELQPGENDPGEAISPLKKGQKIPFTGLGFSISAVAKFYVWFEYYDKFLEIEKNYLKDKLEAEHRLEIANLEASNKADLAISQVKVDSAMGQVELLQKQLEKEINSRPNITLWTSLGVVAGVGVTILIAYALSDSSN